MTTTEAKRITELRDRGMSARGIARILKRPHSTILYVERQRFKAVINGSIRPNSFTDNQGVNSDGP